MNKNELSIKTMLIQGAINLIELTIAILLSGTILTHITIEPLAYLLTFIILGAAVIHTKTSFTRKVMNKIK